MIHLQKALGISLDFFLHFIKGSYIKMLWITGCGNRQSFQMIADLVHLQLDLNFSNQNWLNMEKNLIILVNPKQGRIHSP